MYLKIQSNDCLWSINMALTRHSYPNLHSRKDPTWITVSVHIRSYFITKREYEFDSYLIILSILCIIVLLLLHSAQAQFSSCSATDQKERTWRKFYYYYYKAVGGGHRGEVWGAESPPLPPPPPPHCGWGREGTVSIPSSFLFLFVFVRSAWSVWRNTLNCSHIWRLDSYTLCILRADKQSRQLNMTNCHGQCWNRNS